MNQRIKELVEQATTKVGYYPPSGNGYPEYRYDFDQEKFAELIVRECVREINLQCFPSNSYEWCEKGAWNGYLVAHIRQHFGVEE